MKRAIKFLMITVIFLSSCSVGKMALKKGDKRYQRGEYDVAIDFYEKAVARNVATAKANFFIAESYRLSNRIKQAEPFYKLAVDEGYDDEGVHYYYALSLKANEKYSEAQKILENYLTRAREKTFIELARHEADNLQKINDILSNEGHFRVRNLEAINTPAAEYSPVYRNGELYFTSSRFGGKIYKATGTAFTNIYKAQTSGAVVDTNTIEALEHVNSPNTNDGSIAFSPDGNTMVFAKGNSGKSRGSNDVNLYISRYRRGEWSEPELMNVNDPNSWDSTPAFSRDGRTLYFASNRSGGFGGTDLYSATIDARGRWGNVRNLGPRINTSGNEMFPFASDDGKLYFSSTGHPGLGNLDIFVAYREGGDIVVENLGPSINSNADDFGFFLFDPTRGFFSSNRSDGMGDDDIYTFINNDPDLKIINYYLAGTTVTLNDNNVAEVLPNVRVRLEGNDREVIDEIITGPDGKFLFRVYSGETYTLFGEKTDYLSGRNSFSMIGKEVPKEELVDLVTNKTFETTVQLDRIVIDRAIVVENIYYDLDRAEIRPDAALELDKLVQVLVDNPEITIELSAHTDSRADDDYNMDLSQRRARSAVDYIITKGINPNRIVARGYGETRLLISDEQIAKLPTEEAREAAHQRNRRTEFRILTYDKDQRLKKEAAQEDEGLPSDGSIESQIQWDDKL
jgi:peptidoglycan-associated lipoprotein